MRARVRRIAALLRKEAQQVVRNPVAIGATLAGPLVLLVLFAYSLTLDTERVPFGIVIEQSTPDARDLAGSFYNTRYFHSVFMPDRRVGEQALADGEISGLIVLAEDFTRQSFREGDAPIQVLIDGVDARTSRMVASYAEGAVANWLSQRTLLGRIGSAIAVRSEARVWFNDELNSRIFTVPGVIALLMAVIGPLLSALLVAREWEHGTMESLLATPVSPRELLFTKLAFYMALGVAALGLMLALAVYAMGVPCRGSVGPILLAAPLFIFCSLAIGLLISVTARDQLAAVKLTLTTGFLPAYMLSGFLFDLRNAPDPIRWLSFAIPSRYFVSIMQTVLLAGDVWPVLGPDLLGLAAVALALAALLAVLLRRRLT